MESTSVTLFILVLFGAFYFILVRPVLRQQRDQRRQMAHLRVGDEVVTTGGLLAKVIAIETPEEGPVRLVLELGPGVLVNAVPQAILQRIRSADEESDERPGIAPDDGGST